MTESSGSGLVPADDFEAVFVTEARVLVFVRSPFR
jgi:hypothetical protein